MPEAPVLAELQAKLTAGMVAWSEADFDRLAQALFAYQYTHNEPARRYWQARGAQPDTVDNWRAIPPVPVTAFKVLDLAVAPASACEAIFRTSGTTQGAEMRGRHLFPTLAFYHAALTPIFRHFLLPDEAKLPFLLLAPSPAQAGESSLSHYLAMAARTLGAGEPQWLVDEQGLQVEALFDTLDSAVTTGQPVLIAGTAFSLVHALDAATAAGRRWVLPLGSRLMETGGFKGKSREVERDALYAQVAERLGIPTPACVNQYGMTELSSNFYDITLRAMTLGEGTRGEAQRVKRTAPWCRVRILDPDTLAEQPAGQVGLIALYDLANSGSVLALLTQDLGRLTDDGLEVLGRAAGSEPRGCSIAMDDFLAATRGRHT